jgi:hypothetical protein
MNYVVAAWLSCAAILVVYALRTVHRERSLRRSLAPKAFARKEPLAPKESRKWT